MMVTNRCERHFIRTLQLKIILMTTERSSAVLVYVTLDEGSAFMMMERSYGNVIQEDSLQGLRRIAGMVS